MKSSKFDQSTFIDSAADQSFSQENYQNGIIFQKGPPLHSCFDIYLRKNKTRPYLNSICCGQGKNKNKEN